MELAPVGLALCHTQVEGFASFDALLALVVSLHIDEELALEKLWDVKERKQPQPDQTGPKGASFPLAVICCFHT